MNRAGAVVHALLDAEENFDPREYLLSQVNWEQYGFKEKGASWVYYTPWHGGYVEYTLIFVEEEDDVIVKLGFLNVHPEHQQEEVGLVGVYNRSFIDQNIEQIIAEYKAQTTNALSYEDALEGFTDWMTVESKQWEDQRIPPVLGEAEDLDLRDYVTRHTSWPPPGFVPNGPRGVYGYESKEPFTDAGGRKYKFNIHIYPEEDRYILTVYGRYFDSWHDFHQEKVKFEDDLEGYMAAIEKAIRGQKPGNRSYPRLPDFYDFQLANREDLDESEDFDAREYFLNAPERGEYELRKWLTGYSARSVTVIKEGESYSLGVVRDDLETQHFGPFTRHQVEFFKAEWYSFRGARWTGDRVELRSVFESTQDEATDADRYWALYNATPTQYTWAEMDALKAKYGGKPPMKPKKTPKPITAITGKKWVKGWVSGDALVRELVDTFEMPEAEAVRMVVTTHAVDIAIDNFKLNMADELKQARADDTLEEFWQEEAVGELAQDVFSQWRSTQDIS